MRRAELSVRVYVGLLALCVIVCLTAGCGGGGGGGSSTPVTAPVIGEVRATLSPGMSRDGGHVGIEAVVTDDTEVSSVTATITGPNSTGNTTTVTLVATTLNMFYGDFVAPPISTGGAERYTVNVSATDNSGNPAAAKSCTFLIPDCPPPPPDI